MCPVSSAVAVNCTQLLLSTLSVQLLLLHASVLEPNLHLTVGQVNAPADLQAALPRQIHVEQKLLLQLQCLVLCVGTPLLPATLGF